MKRSTLASLVVLFVLIPATMWLGSCLPGRSYYITGTLVVMELLVPFLMVFEGREPQARELVMVAVMCALAVAARAAIPIPNFKPIYGVIMISGIAFGGETGFLVGAVSAFASNMFYGQGAYTPWQMLAYGLAGLLAGFAFAKGRLPRHPLVMAVFGFVCTVLIVGPVLDSSTIFLVSIRLSWKTVWPFFVSGFPINVSQGICTFLTLLLLGRPLLEKLDRVKVKYGMMEPAERNQ